MAKSVKTTEYEIKYIRLTNSWINVKVDDSDFEFLSKFKWFAKKSRTGYYACTSVRVKNRVLTFRMHRLVMRCFDDNSVDHINANHFDNRQENLEIVSIYENIRRYNDEVPF